MYRGVCVCGFVCDFMHIFKKHMHITAQRVHLRGCTHMHVLCAHTHTHTRLVTYYRLLCKLVHLVWNNLHVHSDSKSSTHTHQSEPHTHTHRGGVREVGMGSRSRRGASCLVVLLLVGVKQI